MRTEERRTFEVVELRVERRDDGEGAPTIRGHAAVFNERSVDLGGFREQIAPGAFEGSVSEDDIRALFNHNPDLVLGRNVAKTLRLEEDKRGLAFEIDPPDTQAGRDVVTSIERGDVSGMSFGFVTLEDEWVQEAGEDLALRTLQRVQLRDVSPVTYPAYPQTDVALRSLEAWRAEAPGAPKREIRRRRLALTEGVTDGKEQPA